MTSNMRVGILGSGVISTRILAAYLSRSGNTREIANQIHKSVGGDIFEIQALQPYPHDYDTVVRQARQELDSGYKPALKTTIENIKSYDLVFVGYPNWWGMIPAPVRTFLHARRKRSGAKRYGYLKTLSRIGLAGWCCPLGKGCENRAKQSF
jgi:flavodoxin